MPRKARENTTLECAQRIASLRQRLGMSQADLAHRLEWSGLTVLGELHGNQGDKEVSLDYVRASQVMGAPVEWCPNSRYTSLLRVKGNSVQQMMHDGDILAVDSSQTDRSQLNGKVVVVANK